MIWPLSHFFEKPSAPEEASRPLDDTSVINARALRQEAIDQMLGMPLESVPKASDGSLDTCFKAIMQGDKGVRAFQDQDKLCFVSCHVTENFWKTEAYITASNGVWKGGYPMSPFVNSGAGIESLIEPIGDITVGEFRRRYAEAIGAKRKGQALIAGEQFCNKKVVPANEPVF